MKFTHCTCRNYTDVCSFFSFWFVPQTCRRCSPTCTQLISCLSLNSNRRGEETYSPFFALLALSEPVHTFKLTTKCGFHCLRPAQRGQMSFKPQTSGLHDMTTNPLVKWQSTSLCDRTITCHIRFTSKHLAESCEQRVKHKVFLANNFR